MTRLSRIALLALFAVASVDGHAARKPRPADLLLPNDGFPELSAEDSKPTAVSFAKGAPAVILLEAEQNEWEGLSFLRTTYVRRTKVLTADGIEPAGDLSFELLGGWRVKKIEARTVLADGTVIDASDSVFREKSEDKQLHVVRVSFPRVEVGAILDFRMTITTDGLGVEPWILQHELPVLHSRFVMIPPLGLKFRKALVGLPSDLLEPQSVNLVGRDAKAFIWTFDNLAPLPDEAFLPPRTDVAQRLIIILDSYRGAAQYIPIATDWKAFSENRKKAWDEWLRKDNSEARVLARQVTEGQATAEAKAEAVRRELRRRVRREWYASWPGFGSPDEVLREGYGTSAEIAATAAAMLRAVGVQAELASIRRRTQGSVPPDFPVPALFDHMLLRIRGENGPTFVSPSEDIPVGGLPSRCRGTLAIVLDGEAEAPEQIPDMRSADNRTERTAQVSLGADGVLTGTSTHTLRGVDAERWRGILTGEDSAVQNAHVEQALQTWMPETRLDDLQIDNLDDAARDLILHCKWHAAGYAVAAGKRVLVNPYLFRRFSTKDWAAETRRTPIDFDHPYDEYDRITLKLPEGTREVKLPTHSRMDAGPAGLYETTLERSGRDVRIQRHMRLDVYRYPAESYASLRRWFADIAAADDESIVVTLQ